MKCDLFSAILEMNKMFPTPPSIDTGLSPVTGTETDHLVETVHTKTSEKTVTRSITENLVKVRCGKITFLLIITLFNRFN